MRLGLLIGLMTVVAAASAFAQGGGPKPGAVLVFETVRGTFEIETYPSEAPKTVAHVVGLVNKRFYNGLRIHRVVPNFVVQFGDPQSRDMTKKPNWGRQSSGKPVGVVEISKTLKHTIGTVSMAHPQDPSKADSQLFLVIGPASHLDGKHQIIGKVASGMDVVRKLAEDDRIIRATVKGAK